MNRRSAIAATGVPALTLLVASSLAGPGLAMTTGPAVTRVDQVANHHGVALRTDHSLVNAWGLAGSPKGPLWVANNGTGTATAYRGGVGGAAVTKVPVTVKIPGGAPTGQVSNNTHGFRLRPSSGTSSRTMPATTIFASESGRITAWSAKATGTRAVVEARVHGAVFKGLALWHSRHRSLLLATDFAGGRIRAFDTHFHQVSLPAGTFHDPRLPSGYAPFNVMTRAGAVYVAYAKQVPGSQDEAHGPGLGFVDRFTHAGMTVHRIASRGPLNAPWGMTTAPRAWGHLAGDLLVGNFGSGRIDVYRHAHFVGQLRNTSGHPITIDGLWGLRPGTASTGGTGSVWFSSGPNDEKNGLLGQLLPAR
jgi:uncharacterized protein (TIGR03118 family)